MRGIGTTFSRLPRAAAWLAGAALLAGAVCPKAFAQADETAMAVPRLAPFDNEVALPRPLAAPDAALLRRLFAQPRLEVPESVRQWGPSDPSARLNDELLGHVLASRYLRGSARTAAADLARWLARYPALPDAAAIAGLLHRRDPAAALPVPLPAAPVPLAAIPSEAPGGTIIRNPLLDQSVRQRLHDARFDAALHLIGRTRGLDPCYGALLRAEVAQSLFAHNRDAAALALAQQAAQAGRGQVALADYIGGLAAWRLGLRATARSHFAAAAHAPVTGPALRAASAYWAGRASLAAQDLTGYRAWMTVAAAGRATFYGQIAARALGRPNGSAFAHETLGEADVDAVAAEPGGFRAFALLQLGQTARAEAELRLLAASAASRPALVRAVMLVASRAGCLDLAADLAALIRQPGGLGASADPLAVPRLRPRNGFLMDPALVYALTRIESNFDPHAQSGAGAQGLMQLMPRTASYVAAPSVPATAAPRLHDPAINLDLGQRYVAYLADHDVVGGDLIRLLASYNAGPASFGRWSGDIRDFGDPLLFIEAIPNDETRNFVQLALAYTWIYAARLHLPAPSLDSLAAFRFPRFSAARARPAVLH